MKTWNQFLESQEKEKQYTFSDRIPSEGERYIGGGLGEIEHEDPSDITHVFDVHHQGKNVGYLAVSCHEDPVHFDALYVDPEHRKGNVAGALLRRGVEKFGDKHIALTVMPYKDKHLDSSKLERFYGRYGFKPVSGDLRRRSGSYRMIRHPQVRESLHPWIDGVRLQA